MTTPCPALPSASDLTMTNCVLSLAPGICGDPPGNMFLFVFATGIGITLVFTFVMRYWHEHMDRAVDAIKRPWQLKSGIFILYCLFTFGYSIHWTLGNYLNSVGVAAVSAYFSDWVIPNLIALSCFVSTIWLLTARLGEIARSSLAELSTRNSVSHIEKVLIVISVASPIIATILCLANMGTNYGIWAAYTYQLEVQVAVSIILIIGAEYAVRTNDLSSNALFTSALARVRAMTAVLVLHTLFNILQNTLHVVMFPMFVWRIWEISELLTIQKCLNIGSDAKSHSTATKGGLTKQGTVAGDIVTSKNRHTSGDPIVARS